MFFLLCFLLCFIVHILLSVIFNVLQRTIIDHYCNNQQK